MDFPGLKSQVNGDLVPGEPDFTEAELDAGLAKWGALNLQAVEVKKMATTGYKRGISQP
jgi:hypothetical protein